MSPDLTLSLQPADPRTFTGDAFTRLVGSADHDIAVKLYYVRFEPEARTFWHIHWGVQILVVTTGICRYQRDGEPIEELRQGESVRFEPGIRHWHGASREIAGEHIAINLDVRDTDWLDEVLL